jgi:hypothetical protein
MVSDNPLEEASVATAEFELALRSLVLESFALGARVEGTWEIELEPTDVPDWTVEIRKMTPDEGDGGGVRGRFASRFRDVGGSVSRYTRQRTT